MFKIVHYRENGHDFFKQWRDNLRDNRAKIAVDRTILNLEQGNFGSHKPCRAGVWELIIDFGPGFRIYYSIIGKSIILLLCAGTKRGQQKDIDKAVEYLKNFKEEHI